MATATIQFCQSCNNMLYPREDRAAKKLMYVCRRCGYDQEAAAPTVYRHEIVKAAADQLAKIPPDVIDDPALTRSEQIVCPSCEGVGGVVIQAKTGPTDDKIKLIFVCKNKECTYKWQE